MSVLVSYAQNREDIYLNWLLDGQSQGFYVDVGASDPAVDSVTKFFYDMGWSGVNIEPIARHASELRRARPRDTTLQVAISRQPGRRLFREVVHGDGLSRISSELTATETDAPFQEYEVQVVSLAHALSGKGISAIDFLKVDVEGDEYDVLASNDWARFRPRVVVAEANHITNDWRLILREQKYDHVFFDGLNEYYTCDPEVLARYRTTFPELVIAQTILDRKTLEHLRWLESRAVAQRDAQTGALGPQGAGPSQGFVSPNNASPSRGTTGLLISGQHALWRLDRWLARSLGMSGGYPRYRHSRTLSIAVSRSSQLNRPSLLAIVKAADVANYFRRAGRHRIGPHVYRGLKRTYLYAETFLRRVARASR